MGRSTLVELLPSRVAPLKGLLETSIGVAGLPRQPEATAASSRKLQILSFLVVQNVAVILLMRFSRSHPGEGRWSAQTGVIMQEIVKGAVSAALLHQQGGLWTALDDATEVLKMGVPALLYLIQNNMQYVAAAHLDAPTLAVTSQLKVLTTALFSVSILKRDLSKLQWAALLLLAAGVALVSVSQLDDVGKSHEQRNAGRAWLGFCAIVVACIISGLATVYFEKTLKGSQVSMWARNLQLSLFSIAIGAAGLVSGYDWDLVRDHGFFGGYNAVAWLTISVNALGGLLVALAIKEADSIVKNFSTSIAIVLTSVLSAVMFGTAMGPLFGLGVAMVVYAVLLYGGMVTASMCETCL